jgi:copper(I)-binding protein
MRLCLLATALLLLAACTRPDGHADHGAPVADDPAHQHHAATAEDGAFEGAWARAVAGTDTARVHSAVYFTLDNPGDTPLRLVAAETDVAERTELHETTMEGGVMRMRPVEGVDVPPGGSVTLEPGGLHVMLLGVRRDLAAGDTFALTLRFADGGERTLEVTVRPPAL